MAASDDNPKLDQLTHVEHISTPDGFEYSDEAADRGAALQEVERQMKITHLVKLHWKPVLLSGVAFMSAGMYGYDNVANNATLSMPAFTAYFGDIGPTGAYLPSNWAALWSSMSNLFQAVGALIAGFLMDRFGRKYVGAALSGTTLIGTAAQYVTQTRGGLLVGKMIVGLGVGGSLAVGLAYASEISPLKIRAPIQQAIILWQVIFFACALGVLRSFTPVMDQSAFRDIFAIQWAVGGIATILFLLVPESPNYLVQKERLPKAHRVMTKIYGGVGSVDDRLAFLVKTIRDEKAAEADLSKLGATYLDCFRGVNLKRTLTTMFLYSAYVCCGSNFLTQNTLILITAGLNPLHVYDIAIGGFGLAILVIIASWFLDGRFRRHNAFFGGLIFNLLFLVAIGAMYYVPGDNGLWASSVLMNLLITLETSILQGMGWPIAAELSSYQLRGKTLAIGTLCQTFLSWLTSFVVPYMFNVDSGNLSVRTAFVFAGINVPVIVTAWFVVPDTTDLLMSEIDERYERKVKPRHFQKGI